IFVAADAANNNEPTLYCATTNSAAGGVTLTPLVPGVESFQVLYGQDTDNDGVVNRFVPASSLTSATVGSVKSIVVSIVVRSDSSTNVTTEAKTFNHFGASYAGAGDAGHAFTSPSDARLRRLYTTTVAVRNNL
ncbi:MAG TPA: PilW family protein, partial [Vicinamibacterales bacterium]